MNILNSVLLIDDDKVTLMLCKYRLLKSNFCKEVITLETGAEAITYFEEKLKVASEERNMPELILLDINMPVMNGWEFLSEFETHFQNEFDNIRIDILTSSIDPRDEVKAKSHPLVSGFISKPLIDLNLSELSRTFKAN